MKDKPVGTICYRKHLIENLYSYSIAIFQSDKAILGRGIFSCPSKFPSKEECLDHAKQTMKLLGLKQVKH